MTMSVIVCDSEPVEAKKLTDTLKELDAAIKIEYFSDSYQALDYVMQHKQDNVKINIAFLETEMVGLSGIDLAKNIKEVMPNTKIIFVTKYSEYAMDAWIVAANGYLLKPVNKASIEKALLEIKAEKENSNIFARTFGNFELFVEKRPVKFKSDKPKEVLAYLIDRMGANITTRELAAAIWEDSPYDKNTKNKISRTINSMIASLEEVDAETIIIRSRNHIAVDIEKFQCDYYDFLHGDEKAEKAFHYEYMTNYGWGEFTLGCITNQMQKGNKK